MYKQLSRYTVLLKKFVKQPFIIFKYQDLMSESIEPPDLLLSLKVFVCLRHNSQSCTCMYSDTRTRHWHNLTDYKSHQSPTFTLTVDSFDLKYWSEKGNDDCCLTLLLPWVIKTEFLLTIPIQYQADKWWE